MSRMSAAMPVSSVPSCPPGRAAAPSSAAAATTCNGRHRAGQDPSGQRPGAEGLRRRQKGAAAHRRSLVTQLRDESDPCVRERLWQRLRRCEQLSIAEPGYVRTEREEPELLCQVVAGRCGRGSIIVTASLAPSAWMQCLADAALVEAMPGRLCHEVIRLYLQGPSWRLEQARRTAD